MSFFIKDMPVTDQTKILFSEFYLKPKIESVIKVVNITSLPTYTVSLPHIQTQSLKNHTTLQHLPCRLGEKVDERFLVLVFNSFVAGAWCGGTSPKKKNCHWMYMSLLVHSNIVFRIYYSFMNLDDFFSQCNVLQYLNNIMNQYSFLLFISWNIWENFI